MNNFCLKQGQGLKVSTEHLTTQISLDCLLSPQIQACAAEEFLINHQMNKDME